MNYQTTLEEGKNEFFESVGNHISTSNPSNFKDVREALDTLASDLLTAIESEIERKLMPHSKIDIVTVHSAFTSLKAQKEV